MASQIAFDNSTNLALGTGDRNFNHTPTGTPKGVLVIIVDGVGTDQVVGVTYGGVTMTEVALSPSMSTGGEAGSTYAYFLGSSIPTGQQSVAIDRADATNYIAVCYTVTATGDTQVQDTSVSSSTSTAAPGATLTIKKDSFVAGGLYSGSNNPGSTAGAGTQNDHTGDFGTDTAAIGRGTSIKTGDFSYVWSQSADDGISIVIAVSQIAELSFGQAQAHIKITGNGYAQALAKIDPIRVTAGAGGTSVTSVISSGVSILAGDLIVVIWQSTTTVSSITDDSSNTYRTVSGSNVDLPNGNDLNFVYAIAQSDNADLNVTLNLPLGDIGSRVIIVKGQTNKIWRYHSKSADSATGTNPNSSSVGVFSSRPNENIIIGSISTSTTPAIPTSPTFRQLASATQGTLRSTWYEYSPTSSSQTLSATISSSGWAASVQSFTLTSPQGFAQAQADIKQTYRDYAQAQASILKTTRAYANVKTQILATAINNHIVFRQAYYKQVVSPTTVLSWTSLQALQTNSIGVVTFTIDLPQVDDFTVTGLGYVWEQVEDVISLNVGTQIWKTTRVPDASNTTTVTIDWSETNSSVEAMFYELTNTDVDYYISASDSGTTEQVLETGDAGIILSAEGNITEEYPFDQASAAVVVHDTGSQPDVNATFTNGYTTENIPNKNQFSTFGRTSDSTTGWGDFHAQTSIDLGPDSLHPSWTGSVIGLRQVPYPTGQAQALIDSGTRVHGQAQTQILSTRRGYGQANAFVAPDFTSVTDTFTRSETDTWGTADVGGLWRVILGTASNVDVNGSVGTILGTNNTYLNLRKVLHTPSAEFTYDFSLDSLPDSGEFIYINLLGYAEVVFGNESGSEMEIDSAGNAIIRVLSGGGVNNGEYSLPTPYVVGQTWRVKLQVLFASGSFPNESAIARGKAWNLVSTEPGWQFYTDEFHALDALDYLIGGKVTFGASVPPNDILLSVDNIRVQQAWITQDAQAQADIKQTYQSYAQAQADIKQVYNAYAQAQADIKQTYRGYGQANAFIMRLVGHDNFNRTVGGPSGAGGTWGTSSDGGWNWGADFTQFTEPEYLYVDGSAGQYDLDGSSAYPSGYPIIKKGIVQFDIWIPADISALSQYWFDTWIDTIKINPNGSGTSFDLGSGDSFIAQVTVDPSSWYTIKAFMSDVVGATIRFKVWKQGTQEPNWQYSSVAADVSGGFGGSADLLIALTGFPFENTQLDNLYLWTTETPFLWVKPAQAQADIKQTYRGYGQAQSDIKATVNSYAQAQAEIVIVGAAQYQAYGQAQASIKAIYNSFGQAQSDIKQTYNAFAQSQAWIEQTYNSFGQSQADIKQIYNAFAQAQANIKQTYNAFAQAQGWIEQTYNGYAQSQASIKQVYRSYSQAQADIKQVYQVYAQAQADIKQTYNVYAQSQADVKQTYRGYGQAQACIVGWAFAQAQADIKQVYRGYAQAQADIKQTYNGFGQAQADIKATYNAFAQAQSDVKQTYNSFGQAQADILQVYQGYGQANCWIEQTYNGFGQSQADIKQTYQAYGQSQADIKQTYNTYAQAQGYILVTDIEACGQAQGNIKQVYQDYGQANCRIIAFGVNQFAQAQGTILFTGTAGYGQAQAKMNAYDFCQWGQANADIKATSNSYGQCQANILQTYNSHAQAQADILQTYQGYGQGNADIKQTYQSYGQAQACIIGWGFGQSQADIKQTYQGCGQANCAILGAKLSYAQCQADIKQTYNAYGQSQADILQTYNGYGQCQAQIKQTYQGYAQAQACVKGNGFGQAQADIEQTYNGYGQSQGDIKQTYNGYGQAQGEIKQTYQAYGQAEALIRILRQGYGQANADILATTNRCGQANADILATTNKCSNAQALISTNVIKVAQAQALIKISSNAYGQALALITSGTAGYGQAQAYIYTTENKVGQAQGFIVKPAGYGQARAEIIRTHTLRNVEVSDEHSILSVIEDEAEEDIDTEDVQGITITLEDLAFA